MNSNSTSIIIGAGSIGLRHAEALRMLGLKVAFVTSRTDLDYQCFKTVEEAVTATSAVYVVVANVTSNHAVTVENLSKSGFRGKVLVEKPAQLRSVSVDNFEHLAVAYNLRFHPVLLELRKRLEGVEVFAIQCYVGQHLSTWRKGRPVQSQYSSHAESGGGVLRDLAHELDYLTWLLGPWKSLAALGGRIAEVTVDSDDSWAVIGELSSAKQFSLQMNYLDTAPRRELSITTSIGTFRANLISMTLEIGDSIIQLAGKPSDTYLEMHRAYLGGEFNNLASAKDGEAVDEFIQSIEFAASNRKWVYAR